MKYRGEIGTLIHGTMRSEDLLRALSDELGRLSTANVVWAANLKKDSDFWQWFAQQGNRDALIARAKTVDPKSNEAFEIVNDLFEELNKLAPEGCYFGAHPGDGADYGFWPIENELTE